MVNINCCINPFCYAVQYREFQEQVRNIFCKRNTTIERNTESLTISNASGSGGTENTTKDLQVQNMHHQNHKF